MKGSKEISPTNSIKFFKRNLFFFPNNLKQFVLLFAPKDVKQSFSFLRNTLDGQF